MSRVETITNFKDSNGVDLGKKLVTKDYLISVYPEIGDKIGIPPELWVWGTTNSGKLGNGTQTGTRSTPVTTFSGGSNWRVAHSGATFGAAIKTDGTLWMWGSQANGLLGNGVTAGVIVTPVTTFAGGTNWKSIATGGYTAAIKTDGTLWTWGTAGRLGNAQTTNRSTPVTTFAGGTNWKQVSSSGAHMVAIKTDGTLWIWGNGNSGALGNGVTTNAITPVTTFAGGNNWKQAFAGGAAAATYFTAAIKTDGTLWMWGSQSVGRLGNGVTTGGISTPITTFAGGTNWKQVSISSAGGSPAAIKTDGTLWMWGQANLGQLGNAATATVSTPVTTFAGGNNWKQVSVASDAIAAIKTDGTLWTWGNGSFGALGNNSITNRSTPVTTFAGGTNWKQVSAAGSAASILAIQSVDFSPF